MKKNVEILFEIEKNIENFKNVKLEIVYSGGETELELDYECAQISKENNFTKNQIKKIEKLLECGYETDIVDFLENYYMNSNYTFNRD